MIRGGRGPLLCVLGIWLLASVPTDSLVPELTPAAQASAAQEGPQSRTLELVVSVTDSIGRPVTDLGKDDFRVTEGNQPQAVLSFSRAELPVSYELIVDTTGSMRKLLPLVLQAANTVVASQRFGDRACLIKLSNGEYPLALDWTSDRASLSKALEAFGDPKGPTALIDSLFSGCEHLASDRMSSNRRYHTRAIVLISDGLDNKSRHSSGQLAECLRKAAIEVHALSLFEEPAEKFVFAHHGDTFLKMLAKETGGFALFPGLSQPEVSIAARQILPVCRFRYFLGYSPPERGSNPRGTPQVKLVGEASRKKYTIFTKPPEGSQAGS